LNPPYLIMAVIYPTIALMLFRSGPDDVWLLWPSPFFGMFLAIGWVAWRGPSFDLGRLAAMTIWVLLAAGVAFGLLRMTLANFDRFLGRTPELPEQFIPVPAPKPSGSRSAELHSDWA
jgi:hypothetical protein